MQLVIKRFLVITIVCLGGCLVSGAQQQDPGLSPEMKMDILFIQASQQADAGKWAEAAQTMAEVATLGLTLSNDFHFSYGETLLKAGQENKAMTEFTRYLAGDGTNGLKFDRAVSNLWQNVRASELSTNLTGALRQRVVEDFVRRGVQVERWEEATKDYEELARLKELAGDEHFQRAVVSEKAGKYTEGLQIVTAYIKRFGREAPHYSAALQLYGRCESKAEEETKLLKAAAISLSRQSQASKDTPWENSLGLKFVPVAGTKVLFAIWETRVKDYQEYARAADREVRECEFSQGSDHPVVNVSWNEAKSFCEWLTQKERTMGLLSPQQCYRLPTDEEWSLAVGLTNESGSTPSEKHCSSKEEFPWGTRWPPPAKAGNYGAFFKTDGYENTSPAGSFSPNRFGIYDMGGNAWEFCEDWFGGEQTLRTARGGSWDTSIPSRFASSYRYSIRPEGSYNVFGFRCVLAADSSSQSGSFQSERRSPKQFNLQVEIMPRTMTEIFLRANGKLVVAGQTGYALPGATPLEIEIGALGYLSFKTNATFEPDSNGTWKLALERAAIPSLRWQQRWENTLGMKFVKVPGSGVYFSVWETRVRDYELFVTTTGHEWKREHLAQSGFHPCVNVSWNDAKAFCLWLTRQERALGVLSSGQYYRLPTDAEWSEAVGLAYESGSTPKEKDGKAKDVYPWGNQWPPPWKAGNYSESLRVDPYEFTSPVGACAPNRYEICDLGGSVWEWCEDWYDEDEEVRVLRGASYGDKESEILNSSCRDNGEPDWRRMEYGFRCVLDKASN